MKSSTQDLSRIDPGLYMIISSVESATNSDFYLTSVERSEEENKAVGGWYKSQHVDWDGDGDSQAVDIRRSSFVGSPESIAKMFYSQGATGVGIYDTHIHVDNNPDRINDPYFKDYRTTKSKFDEKLGITFDYFKDAYNKTLAEIRKGKNDNVSHETISDNINNKTKFSNEILIGVGVAVVTIFTLLGLFDD